MFSILMVIVSIALFATVTLVTINYIPIDALIAFKARSKAQEGLQSLAAGSVRYIKSVTDVNGITTLPAPGTDLSATLQPTFAFIPVAPSGMGWKVESSTYSGMPAVAICLFPSGTIDDATQRGVASVRAQFPAAAVFVSSNCQAVSNGTGAYVTYWVIANHHG